MTTSANLTCGICLDDIFPVESIASHQAQSSNETANRVTHVFHRSCFSEWFNRMRSEAACPICRAPAKEFGREYAYHLTCDEKEEMLSIFLFIGIISCVGRLLDYYLF